MTSIHMDDLDVLAWGLWRVPPGQFVVGAIFEAFAALSGKKRLRLIAQPMQAFLKGSELDPELPLAAKPLID